MSISIQGVSINRGSRRIINDVSLTVDQGQSVALVGPNGSGKSTLVGGVSGDLELSSGTISIENAELGETKILELARLRAVMTQEVNVSFGFTVDEVVLMGRSPWQNTPSEEQDLEVVTQCLEQMDIVHLRDRGVQFLSGGELARVAMARVLAQSTPVLILDEPTAALDLRHQVELLNRVKQHTSQGGTALVILHDLTLAANHMDKIAVLSDGEVVAFGSPEEVLTPEILEPVYQTEIMTIKHPTTGKPVVVAG